MFNSLFTSAFGFGYFACKDMQTRFYELLNNDINFSFAFPIEVYYGKMDF